MASRKYTTPLADGQRACYKCGRREIPDVTEVIDVVLPSCAAALLGGRWMASLCEECMVKALKSKAVERDSNLNTETMTFILVYRGKCDCGGGH